MQIKAIRWKNYRRLVDGAIDLRGRNLVLIGPNDCGKSSIVWALHLCLGIPGAQLQSAVHLRDLSDPATPLQIEIELHEFDDKERAAFPDEIEPGPPETLVIRLEVTIDPDDASSLRAERRCPFGGHQRGMSRVQLEALGWAYVTASRSLTRELGTNRGGLTQELMSSLDLSGDSTEFATAGEHFRAALDQSHAISGFRAALANALSDALPQPVATEDVAIVTTADLLENPLADASVTIRDRGHLAPLAEQSDGVRALSLLALFQLSSNGAKMVGIDEPETHLHVCAQRSVADRLMASDGQKIIVTHSSAIVSRINPRDIAVFTGDRQARQLPPGAKFEELHVAVRHWGIPLLDALTARRVIVVEGPADRILLEAVAPRLGHDLNRSATAVVELTGASMFPIANALVGKPGFDLPLFGLVDADAAEEWADELGVQVVDLEAEGIFQCDPDLEGEYGLSLGAERLFDLLVSSGLFEEAQILSGTGAGSKSDVTITSLAQFCGHKRRKIPAAIAIAKSVTADDASKFTKIASLLAAATA